MRPNLSVEKIAGALAVLGTTALITACGGDAKPPVNANEVAPAGEKAAGGEGHCGADKAHKEGEAKCAAKGGDAKPAEAATPATPATPAADAKPADAKPADAKPADAKPADPKGAAPAPAGSGKKPAAPPAPGAKKSGAGSCGAGTCSAKK